MNKIELLNLIRENKVALMVIDMQGDYCGRGYYMDKAGYDIERLRQPISNIQGVLQSIRTVKVPVIFTRQYRIPREDHHSNDHDFPLTSLKGEPGWEIIPELQPLSEEVILDKTTCSVFTSTDVNNLLTRKGITTLIFCGNTIDVCVHSSLRSANDLGYRCITLSDGCGAVSDNLLQWSLESIQVEGGVFGSVMKSDKLITILNHE